MGSSIRSALSVMAAACCIVGIAASGALGWLAPNETKVSELAPGVFFRKAQTEPVFIGCNQGWIEFRDFVLVIDANFPGQAAEVIKLIDSTRRSRSGSSSTRIITATTPTAMSTTRSRAPRSSPMNARGRCSKPPV